MIRAIFIRVVPQITVFSWRVPWRWSFHKVGDLMRFASIAPLLSRNVLLLCLIVTFAGTPLAQTNATLDGSVHDASGAVVPNADLILTNKETGLERKTKTDTNGNFTFAELPIGSYRLQCQAKGFRTLTYSQIVLRLGDTLRLNLSLTVGEIIETVVVSDEVSILQTGTSQFSTKRLSELPLAPNRNFSNIALSAAGVSQLGSGQTGFAAGMSYSSNGSRVRSNDFLDDGATIVDGVTANDRLFNAPAAMPSEEAIQEFRVQSNLYSAENGGGSFQITIAIKSGSNDFHGSAYEYFRNDRLNARNFFNLADDNHDGKLDRPLYQQNQLGFSIGGPVWKDHTFFFGNTEWLRLRIPQSLALTVPTAKMRQGDFTEFGDGNAATANDVDIRNPFAPGRPVFAGNVIPQNMWNVVAKDLLTLLPKPNRPGMSGNLAAAPAFRNHTNQFNVRLDHRFNKKDSVYGRFSYSDITAYSPFGALTPGALEGSAVPGFGLDLATNNRNLVVNYQRVWTPRLFTEVRFGFNRIGSGQQHQNRGNTVGVRNGIAGLFATTTDEIGVPRILVTGLSPFGDVPYTTRRNSRDYQYDGAVTYSPGVHRMKLGVSFQPVNFAPSVQNAMRGIFGFGAGSVTSGLGFADFLLGLPDSGSSGSGGTADFKGKNYRWFAQDDWRLRKDFSLTYGVRYEYQGPLIDQKLQVSNFDLNTRTIIIPYKNGQTAPLSTFRSAPNGVFLCSGAPCFPVRSAADLGIHPGLLMPDRNNFSPRFGFAWNLKDDFVLRGGYGLYYSHNEHLAAFTMAARPPFQISAAFGPAISSCLAQTQQVCDGTARLQIQNLLESPSSGAFLSPVNPFLRTGYLQKWELATQTSFKRDWLLEISYVGAKGSRLFNIDSRNYRLPGATALNDNTREFFPYLFGMEIWADSGFSNYHGLQTHLNKRYANGLLLFASYIWSKALDNDSNGNSNPLNRAAEKGRSDFDARHRFAFNAVYELPFGRGRRFGSGVQGVRGKLIEGWQLGLTGSWRSATPFTVSSPQDFSNIGRTYGNRPNLAGGPNRGPKTAEQWFNTSAFTTPIRGSFGTAGRNILDGDTQTAINTSLRKDLLITERVKLELRTEMYNVANHTNYGTPNRTYIPPSPFAAAPNQVGISNNINPDFGRIFSAGDPRVLQVALRLNF